MLSKRLAFTVAGATLFLLALFIFADALQVRAESGAAGQLQYRITMDKDLASVRGQLGDFRDGPTAMFQRRADGWQSLKPDGRESTSQWATRALGYSVALDGDYAIIGAQWHDNFKGAAYIFKRQGDGWTQVQRLSPSDLGQFDHFGSSVSISGDYAVVAATWQGLFEGSVYVFKRTGDQWVQQQKLAPHDALPDDQFGARVRIEGSEITVGNVLTDSEKSGSGPVYRFRLVEDIWIQDEKTDLAALGSLAPGSEDAVTDEFMADDLLNLMETIGEEIPGPLLHPTVPPDPVAWVRATDAVFEDRVEVTWPSDTLDAIVYRILRNGVLISVASSQDSLYADETGVPGVTYEYCVTIKNMEDEESAPVCDPGSRIIFPPLAVSASDGQYDQFVRITWTDLSMIEAGYFIRRNAADLDTVAANTGFFDDTTAETEVTYNYEVIAFDADTNLAEPVADQGFRGAILPPLDVSVSDGEYADRVMITWIDQAQNEQGYNIYRNESLIAPTDADVQSYEDWTAEFGMTYTYCVRTLGAGSKESIPICDDGGRGILPAPSSVAASDATFDDRIQITWEYPFALEDGFEIQRDGDPIGSTGANVTVYKDYTATPDVSHEYCVVAFSDQGGRSDPVCDDGFQSLVLAPFDVSATDGEFEDRTVITWQSNSTTAVLFKILRGGTFIKSVSQNSRSYSDYEGTAGEEYDYSVTAVSALEHEAQSDADPGRRELLAPTEVKASDEEYEDRVIVTWTDNSQMEQGYAIYRGETVPDELIGEKGPNSSGFSDNTAVPGMTYVYSVAAFDNLGQDYGESDKGQDKGWRVLNPPDSVQATDGDYEDRVEIFWTDNSSAEQG